MGRAIFWGFILLWGVLGAVTGSGWLSLILVLIVVALLWDASTRASLIRRFRWVSAKLEHFSGAGLGMIAVAIMCYAADTPLGAGVAFVSTAGFVLAAFVGLGVLAHWRVKKDGLSNEQIENYHLANSFFRDIGAPQVPVLFPLSMPSVFLDACLGLSTERLAVVQSAGAAIIAILFTGLIVWFKAPAWYVLPVYLVGGFVGGSALTFSVADSLEGGWKLLLPVALPEDASRATDAKLADPDELKKAGLSRDL